MISRTAGSLKSQSMLVVLAVVGVSLAALMLLTGPVRAQTKSTTSAPASAGDQQRAVSSVTATPQCGPAWRLVSSPSPGTVNNLLLAVAVVSPTDVWAVGGLYSPNGVRSSILHWDGIQWAIVPSPIEGYPYDIDALSADDVWVVGYTFVNGYERALALHWNGIQWTALPVPEERYYLSSVSALSPNDVWAVGNTWNDQTLTMHWDGIQWSVVPSPSPGLYTNSLSSVVAIAANDVWAVGTTDRGAIRHFQTLIMHWGGTQWTIVPSPNPNAGNNHLTHVDASSSNDVWAVGHHNDFSVPAQALVIRWDGSAWNTVANGIPGISSSALQGVKVISPSDIWAVGQDSTGEGRTLVTHWDGSQWRMVPSPNLGASANTLYDIDARSAQDVWAVGSASSGGWIPSQTIAQRYSDPCATPTPANTATPTSTATSTVTHTPTRTPTSTPVPRLVIAQSEVYKPDGNNQGLDVYVRVTDLNGTPIAGALVTVQAVTNFGQQFTTTLADLGGGEYRICDWQRFSGNAGDVTAYIMASMPGYVNASITTTNRSGRWCGVTPTSTSSHTPAPTNTATSTSTPTVASTATPGCALNPNYTVSASTGATIVPGATYVAGSTCNHCTVLLTLPFAYSFYDDTYTQVRASNKGNLQFVTNTSDGADICLPASSFDDTIFAYWDDFNTNINDNLGIYTSVSGTAPNRIFNIEWRARYIANDAAANFQARLYEGEPKFEIVYGNVTRRGFSATVGAQKGGDPARFTQYACNTYGSIQTGMRLTFDRRVCTGAPVVKR